MTKNHTHIYKRLGPGTHGKKRVPFNDQTFRCIDPDCTFVTKAGRLMGKRAVCGICKEPTGFILDRDSLCITTPRCPNCSTSRKHKKITDLANEIEFLIAHPQVGREEE